MTSIPSGDAFPVPSDFTGLTSVAIYVPFGAFDNIAISIPALPVEQSTWGKIKAPYA